MKSLILFLLASISMLSGTFGQELLKLDENEIEADKATLTENFARDFLTTLKNNGVYDFKGQATAVLEAQMNGNNQKLTYQQLKGSFGDFASLKFSQAWKMNDGNQNYTIYRMQAVFSGTTQPVEFRVVMDNAGKIAGIWAAPWKETL